MKMPDSSKDWYVHSKEGRTSGKIFDRAQELRGLFTHFAEQKIIPTIKSWDTEKILDYQLDEVIDLINKFFFMAKMPVGDRSSYIDLVIQACEEALGSKFTKDELEYIRDDFKN